MTDSFLYTTPLDPRAAPLIEALTWEYTTRYGDHFGEPGEEMRRYPAELFAPPNGNFVLLLRNGAAIAGGAFKRYDNSIVTTAPPAGAKPAAKDGVQKNAKLRLHFGLTTRNLDELQARIESLLIRSERRKKPEIVNYEFGGRRVDFRRSRLSRNGTTVSLSEREARLLRYFVENRGKTISRTALLQHVWGYRQAPLTRTVDVHILRLRHKIEDDPKAPRFIVTVPGFGYRFDG